MTGVALWKILVDLEDSESLCAADRAELQTVFEALHRHEVVLMPEDLIEKVQQLHKELVISNQV